MIVSICRKRSCLSACKKINFIIRFFHEILQRNSKLAILGTLGMPGHAYPDLYYQFVEKFRVYLQAKKSTSFPMFFWRYFKDMQTCYFGYFGHAWQHTPKIIISSCGKLRCLSKCQKSFIYFLRYYILKNSAI